jgi:hypothetical protein
VDGERDLRDFSGYSQDDVLRYHLLLSLLLANSCARGIGGYMYEPTRKPGLIHSRNGGHWFSSWPGGEVEGMGHMESGSIHTVDSGWFSIHPNYAQSAATFVRLGCPLVGGNSRCHSLGLTHEFLNQVVDVAVTVAAVGRGSILHRAQAV